MFDPKRTPRIDFKHKRIREENKLSKHDLKFWDKEDLYNDEVDTLVRIGQLNVIKK